MAQARTLQLMAAQHAKLVHVRDNHPKTYLRERAAAMLKVANGMAVRQVAQAGLLKRQRAETVSDWITRSEQHGFAGLRIADGRGRKPAFSPCASGCGRRQTGDPASDHA